MAYMNNAPKAAASTQSTEMFSFAVNPELVNLFWGVYSGRNEGSSATGGIDDGPSIESATIPFFIEPISYAPSPNGQQSQYFLFGYQLPIDADASLTKNVLSVLRHSVITTGIVILVGLGSYCSYYTLQKLRRLLLKDSNVTSCSTASTSSWWPAFRCQKPDEKCIARANIPKSASYSAASSVSQKVDSGICSSSDLEALKLGLTLELKNSKAESRCAVPDSGNDGVIKMVLDGSRKSAHRRLEGEHFSPSPVLSNINRGNAFPSHMNIPKEGRILVGGDEEYAFRGDDDEFQIEYFGPERSSSSSTLSDHSDKDGDIYPDPYKHRSGSGYGGVILPGTTIQTMISPSHSQAATVRRQLDFGNVSPIPSTGSAPPPYLPHHHLPPLSASSSMSLSPSTPTTGVLTSPTNTSTPQLPTG